MHTPPVVKYEVCFVTILSDILLLKKLACMEVVIHLLHGFLKWIMHAPRYAYPTSLLPVDEKFRQVFGGGG